MLVRRCFDGRRPHMAMPFTGERYSLVFYTRSSAHRAWYPLGLGLGPWL